VNKKGFHPAVSVAADLAISAVLLFVGTVELMNGSSGDTPYQQFVTITAGGAIVVVIG
jgi:hypothetical protein